MKAFMSKLYWALCVGLYKLATGKWGKTVINNNKVVASAFGGRKYGDNPMYILDALKEIKPDVEIVWISHPKEQLKVPDHVRIVNKHSLRYFYEYATAKVWIDNELIHAYMQKKDEQMFIETWHAGLGFKRIYFDVAGYDESNRSYDRLKRTTDLANYFLSDSDFFTRICREAFRYKGEVLHWGFPRNDIIVNDREGRCAKELKQELGIDDSCKLMLYAPTFRDGNTDIEARYNVDFARLHAALTKRFGGEWKILLRLHPWLQNADMGSLLSCNYVVNVTNYPDVQRLNAACDACMTDYSSTVFDAVLRRIPCFIYANDFDSYKKSRGVYMEINELPFPYADSNALLEERILTFDDENYQRDLAQYFNDKNVVANGDASHRLAALIAAFMTPNH